MTTGHNRKPRLRSRTTREARLLCLFKRKKDNWSGISWTIPNDEEKYCDFRRTL